MKLNGFYEMNFFFFSFLKDAMYYYDQSCDILCLIGYYSLLPTFGIDDLKI